MNGDSMEQHPDRWLLVEIIDEGRIEYKLLASFYGGYLSGESYRWNSGVSRVEDEGNSFRVHGYSGAIYFCHKDLYGCHSYAAQVLAKAEAQYPEKVRGLIREEAMEVLELCKLHLR